MDIQSILRLATLDINSTQSSPLLPTQMPNLLSQRFQRGKLIEKRQQRIQIKKELEAQEFAASFHFNETNSPLLPKIAPNRTEDETQPMNQTQNEPEYTPFLLHEKSSFSPSKITQSQLNRMDPCTRAKYKAYQKPAPEIMSKIQQSDIRAKKWLNDVLTERKRKQEAQKKKWLHLHAGIEDPIQKRKGNALASLSRQRMKEKREKMNACRVYFF